MKISPDERGTKSRQARQVEGNLIPCNPRSTEYYRDPMPRGAPIPETEKQHQTPNNALNIGTRVALLGEPLPLPLLAVSPSGNNWTTRHRSCVNFDLVMSGGICYELSSILGHLRRPLSHLWIRPEMLLAKS